MVLHYHYRQIGMNTLSFTSLLQKINGIKSVSTSITAIIEGKFPLEIEGCEGAFGAMLLAKIYSARPGRYFAVIPQEIDAMELAADLASLGTPCLQFPGWGATPYRELAPLSAVFGERIKALSDLVMGKPGIVIISQRAFLSPLPPPSYIKSLLVSVKPGARIDMTELSRTLVSYGYIRVPRVQVRGEFALRGEILDIFMGGESLESGAEDEVEAFRVLFDFDRVESVKRFNPSTQGGGLGKEKLAELLIRPMRELVWTDDRIETLNANLAMCNEFSDGGKAIIEELITRRSFAGEEMFYPLAGTGDRGLGTEDACSQSNREISELSLRKKTDPSPQTPVPDHAMSKENSILNYLDDGTLVLIDRERLDNAQESISREYHGLYLRSRRDGDGREFPLPERLLLNFKELIERYGEIKGRKIISFLSIKSEAKPGIPRVSIPCEPSRSFFGNINYMKDEFAALHASGWHIAVAAESEVQAERIGSMLVPHKALSIIASPLSSGFSLPEIKLMVIQENEIFGRRKRPPRSLKTVRSSPIDTFVELNPGDYVVHVNHGIGLFKGIERINTLGFERDYIQLEYAGDETVFVPVEQLNLVQRYIGNEGNAPRLDTIGSKSWENRKGRVKKSVEDIAQRLLELYSKRKQSTGYAYPKDTEWQTLFEAAFPFEETEDQLRCVEEIKRDMESPSPMDRLVCGDVGYGKTEVAVRACFKAIMGGKQAAFLAPTTILAEQHYENFRERFSIFPVRIAMLSRFVDRGNVRTILEKLKNGEVDLLIGTHRIIQRDVAFKNLGLIVIDEEQRFGVKDKERLKELKTNVDCLTLSATPIPRTLHMSLLKIRDMSLLATAPSGRHPIETVIEEYSDERLVRAIRSEVERGGQVFFLHNRIETLRDTRIKIERLVPEILAETAHGQMDAQELEDVMHRFVHGGFHVLVSTTIIENGIDIPNVNTIIIDRADMYGVSQLYQLRGRVGRSDRVAYAYLLYPQGGEITELAMKRLQVISDFTELGSGFKIAMKDMEIRGAGNLLGREQSGDIYSVGFDLYLKLLDEAVRRLENSSYEAETETLLELEYSGFIPDSYIDSQQEKMEVYKMIAAIRDKEELERVYADLQDRFGPPPDEAASLLALAEIRIICRELAVSSLREREGVVRVEFAKVSHVKVDRLVRLMQESMGKVKLDPKKPNVLMLAAGNIGLKEKSEFIREKLAALA
jgi:transcription-repair coupling factor (superfamily II helicase)